MKFFLTLIALMLLVTPASAAPPEGDAYEGGMPPMGKPAEMAALDFMHGEWDIAMKFKMDPAGEWMTTAGTAVSKPILKGCANRMDFETILMGMPFKGFDHTTYNRETGQYESVWIDDMSAKMATMTGGFEGDVFVMTGTDIQGGMEFLSKATSTKVSDDEVYWVMSMSMDEGETWFENMQMTYTRK